MTWRSLRKLPWWRIVVGGAHVGALRIKLLIQNPRGVELHFEDERFVPIELGGVPHDCMAGDYLVANGDGSLVVVGRDVFESIARPLPDGVEPMMDFGDALRALQAGCRVARAGWNGKGMWLSLSAAPSGNGIALARSVPADAFWSANNRAYAEENGGFATVLPCITMKTATGEILMGWLASQSDMLAKDWVLA